MQRARSVIEKQGVRIVLVHMLDDQRAADLFAQYGLSHVDRISDPDLKLYHAFALKRGGVGDVMGPKIWWKGFKATFLGGHLPGKPGGDVFQLGGAFLVHQGEIVRAFRPDNSAVHPDFAEFSACTLPDAE